MSHLILSEIVAEKSLSFDGENFSIVLDSLFVATSEKLYRTLNFASLIDHVMKRFSCCETQKAFYSINISFGDTGENEGRMI